MRVLFCSKQCCDDEKADDDDQHDGGEDEHGSSDALPVRGLFPHLDDAEDAEQNGDEQNEEIGDQSGESGAFTGCEYSGHKKSFLKH